MSDDSGTGTHIIIHTDSVHFFFDTPTVRPLLPVVLVCCPLTRRLEGREGRGYVMAVTIPGLAIQDMVISINYCTHVHVYRTVVGE